MAARWGGCACAGSVPPVLALALAAAVPAAPCGQPHAAAPRRGGQDAVVGPLAILDTGALIDQPPPAFQGLGYKLPITLAHGRTVTVTIGRADRRHARLVFRPAAVRAVDREGITGGDAAIRLRPCGARRGSGRAGWPGGFVVDEPRCVRVRVDVAGGPVHRGRVPVGAAKPPPLVKMW